ncbi:hypothetical protein vseg_003317 [Gypsophila vaccaria]
MGGASTAYHYLTDDHRSSSSSLLLSSSSSSSGFMELLGMPDMIHVSPPLFDNLLINNAYAYDYDYDATTSTTNTTTHTPNHDNEGGFPTQSTPLSSNALNHQDSSEVVNNNNNHPTTPNSSSISSASNNEDLQHNLQSSDEHTHNHKPQKLGRKKKKKTSESSSSSSSSRQREARVAFMTKSEVDHLEDGYRWRKYGQKAVKNSPFPRSYYRCTSASCNVKKRVERSFSDPSIVVTTYEGQHTHPCTVLPRGMMPMAAFGATNSACYALPMQMTNNNTNLAQHLQMNMNYVNSLVPQLSHFGNMSSPNNSRITPLLAAQERHACGATTQVKANFLKDNGLLQDIVPSIMKKEVP